MASDPFPLQLCLGMGPSGIESIDPSAVRSGKIIASVGDKRLLENDEDLGFRLQKKIRGDSGGDMKRVAEIVLVLSAMGKMRGGGSPTDVEKRLMVEARKKLSEICEAVAPMDILPRDAARVVIEDLGLIRPRDQILGFRPRKMSIAEKLLLMERKMEESKEFAARSATYSSQRLQAGFGAMAETPGTVLHIAHRFPLDKTNPTPVYPGCFQPASSVVHVSAVTSTIPLNQLPTNEVQSAMVSSGLSSSHLGRDSSSLALPRMEKTHFRLDGRSNGPAYALQVRANSSNDHPLEKAPSWSLQPQSTSGAKAGQENKVPHHTPINVEGTHEISQVALQATRDQTYKPSVIQTASGSLPSIHQPLQGMNIMQAPSLYTNHNDIARNVQKFLQPRLPDHPNWTPPSRDYMNKALTCQICKVTINDVESSLICDACEKGVHLKCLESYNQKGIPRGEWHCPKCLMASNGKPLPPKYGHVTRNISAPKISSNTGGVQVSSEKKVQNSDKKVNHSKIMTDQNVNHPKIMADQKVNHLKITANGNPGLTNPAKVGSTGRNPIESSDDIKMPNIREMRGANFLASRIKLDDKDDAAYHGTCPDNSRETSGAVLVPPLSGTPNLRSPQHISISESSPCKAKSTSEPKSQFPAKPSDTGIGICQNPQDVDRIGQSNCAEVSSEQYHVNKPTFEEFEKSNSRETSDCEPKYDIERHDEDVSQGSYVGTLGIGDGARDCARSSSDGLNCVDWVGDILEVVDEKTFYQSCCIKGVVYKLHDHALFHSSNDKLTPFKLQASHLSSSP
ncbi:hypothetical protein HHK36_003340 [Tetracentron sinense]|uniref:PHD-type domain-containing protein n=1 Tax=Tetracentron sinense TaxID=13715 RepID=A0A835DNJ8_TETSI|nr:hypothetical protein HHK36_003340 [Tetracentron sinense]